MLRKISSKVFQFYFKKFGSCIYLLKIKRKKIIIDTSTKENRKELISNLKKLGIKPEEIDFVLLTHNHYDHTENFELFKNAKIPNKKDLKTLEIKIIETPGHTFDSKCYLYKKILFSGDTLFHRGIGRIDFPESKPEKMRESLEKLRRLNYKILCPGHLE